MKLIRLPGLIDMHVHLRDPGETQKEDFYTGTSAALAGGITTVFDMPNNIEPIFTEKALEVKLRVAKSKAVCDWGLYFGTDGKNTHLFDKIAEKVVGLKLYLNLTTGKYLVEDEDLVIKIFQTWPKQKLLVVHAEGEKVDLALKMCQRFKNKLHIAHVSTKKTLEKIIMSKKNKLPVTCDVAPHHLFLTDAANLSVKPPLATKKDQEFLWQNLRWIDCLVSEHAPHTLREKKSDNPPSGFPGLETMLPLMLTAVAQDRLSLEEIERLLYLGPNKIFNLEVDQSTYTEVDIEEEYQITNKQLLTKSRWSPYNGWTVKGKVKKVYIRRAPVFENGKVLALQGFGNYIH